MGTNALMGIGGRWAGDNITAHMVFFIMDNNDMEFGIEFAILANVEAVVVYAVIVK